MTNTASSGAPLAGLRIVEVSSYVATPLCGLTLAQLGAEVVRVEPTGGAPDRTRWPLTNDGTSLYWNGLNAGKKSVEVDLLDPVARQQIVDLVVEGDAGGILVTNTERWSEFSYASLAQRRSDIIHVLLTGKHDGGTAVDYTVQAGTGFPRVTGSADHAAPVNHVLPAWDLAAGLHLATGLLAAAHRRTTTGVGAEIRVALEDVALAIAGQLGYLAEAQLRPEVRRSADGNYVYGTFGADFTTADGERFMLVALTPRQWGDLLRITGLKEAVEALASALGADFDDEGDRFVHRRVLSALVAEWFGNRRSEEVRDALASTRILWSPYRTFADLAADDAHLLREHPLFETVEQPGVGRLLAPGAPITVGRTRVGPRPAPLVGQHTDEVLGAMRGGDRMNPSWVARHARTWLFVPGDRHDRFAKAAAAGADVVVLDLEDAVAPGAKDVARRHVASWIASTDGPVAVRINACGSEPHAEDLRALSVGPPTIVLLAKAEDPRAVADVIKALPDGSAVVALIETAQGVLRATELARIPSVVRLALGTYDLAAELGVDPDHRPAMESARGTLVLASAAGGLAGPVDGVTGNVGDTDQLVADITTSARIGFSGKLCIHPAQVVPAGKALAPTDADIEWARRIVAATEAGDDDGVTVVDGRMVDKPVVDRAHRILTTIPGGIA